MEIIIKCGNDDCRMEFKGDTGAANWVCPSCGRVIENKNYPFLTAKLIDAKLNSKNVDWKKMYDELLIQSRNVIIERDNIIRKLEEELRTLKTGKECKSPQKSK